MRNKLIFGILMLSLFLSGCYWNEDVRTDQVGAQIDRNAVRACVGPGVYTDFGWFSDLRHISVSTLTFEVEDPEVATSDNQLVGIRVTIQAQRKGDCDSVRSFLSNWSNLLNDDSLVQTIDANAREAIKNGTRGFTLTTLLNDRNGLALAITAQLEEDTAKYNVDIINVTIENVALDPAYAAILQQTAQLKAQEDFQLRRQSLVEQQAATDLFERQQAQLVAAEQLKLEQAETLIQVEIAQREGEIVAASQQVYELNRQAFELRKLELMAELFGQGTVYFIPAGTDPNLFFGGFGGVVPVQP
jgi:regulator of protease activity HflC (stomatin/prohibitin superfamily)